MDEAMTKNRAPNGSAKRGRNSAKYIYRNIYSRVQKIPGVTPKMMPRGKVCSLLVK
jgi:hypothetical protein